MKVARSFSAPATYVGEGDEQINLTDTRQIQLPGVGVALVALTRATRRRSF